MTCAAPSRLKQMPESLCAKRTSHLPKDMIQRSITNAIPCKFEAPFVVSRSLLSTSPAHVRYLRRQMTTSVPAVCNMATCVAWRLRVLQDPARPRLI